MNQSIVKRLEAAVKLVLTDQLILVVNMRNADQHTLAKQLAQIRNGL